MTEWSLEDWEKHFAESPAASAASAPPMSTGNGMHAHGRPGRQRVEPLSLLGPVVETCTFIQYCRDHQADTPEPWWYVMLSNLARCEGGR
jgi:hypothetical protein